jgi:hypothetical protein
MSQPIDALVEFLEADGWRYHRTASDEIGIFVSGKHGRWLVSNRYSRRAGIFISTSYCPVVVPEAARLDVADFMTRANWGMTVGGFEMDMEDGDLRFKSTVPVRYSPLTQEMCRHVIYVGMAMMERYLWGLLAVIYGGTTPEEAVRQCEEKQGKRLARGRRVVDDENLDISDEKMKEIFEKIIGDEPLPPGTDFV